MFQRFVYVVAALALALLAGFAYTPSTALAQGDCPNYSHGATYGTASLNAGFLPDPHSVYIDTGGSIDVDDCWDIPDQCVGMVARAPDYTVNLSGSPSYLSFTFSGGGDPTLLINDSNGNWHCDDDGDGDYMPRIELRNPDNGIYDIWVGAYSSNSDGGTLRISEYEEGTDDCPFAGYAPSYGTTSLQAGFMPDPHVVGISSGGSIDASGCSSLPSSCVGMVAHSPDYRVQLSGSSSHISFFYIGSGDPTLLIQDANGGWYCNDDSGGTYNPTLNFNRPLNGAYNIWVGALGSSSTGSGQLYVTERSNVTVNSPHAGSSAPTTVSAPAPAPVAAPVAASNAHYYSGSARVVCEPDGKIWFEGRVTNNGVPVNGAQIVFKSRLVPGTTPVTRPAITGPTGEFPNHAPGYYYHSVDADASQANSKHLEIWVQDGEGRRISDHVNWDTDGNTGPCNRAVVNFFTQ